MLPKPYRLTGQANFKKIATQGRHLFSKGLGIKWLPNKLSNSRFAFVVSLKIDKRAVVRNQLKRRLREIVHFRLKEIKSGFDILILTYPTIKDFKFLELQEKLEELLKKSDLL